MLIELRKGDCIDVSTNSIKRLTYQNIRNNRRYFVAIGNDSQAIEYELTFDTYMTLVEALHGSRRNESESNTVLPSKKGNHRKTKADKQDDI